MTAADTTAPALPAAASAPRPGPPTFARLRASILLKILAALAVALAASAAVTALFESRLTTSALGKHAEGLARSQLRILEQAYAERERTLVSSLRNLGQVLNASRLTEAERRNELIPELARAYANLQLDLIRVVDTRGRELSPPAGVGAGLTTPVLAAGENGTTPSSALLATDQGSYVQAVLVPIRSGDDGLLLVGGYEYGDAFAYSLRKQIGDLGHVILVADGAVVGTTLAGNAAEGTAPPAGRRRGRAVDGDSPVRVPIGGVDHLVAYRALKDLAGRDAGALGVALSDPQEPLRGALQRTRLLAVSLLALVALALGWLLFRALTRPLVELTTTAGRIADGDLEATFEMTGSDEIGQLGTSLERMRLELRSQLDLIARQAADLRESSKRIVAAEDEERRRLARDLHDGIQQQLVVLRMGLGLAREAAAGVQGGAPAQPWDALAAELDHIIERLREVAHHLYPSILVDRGLSVALRSHLGRVPISARLTSSPDPLPRLPAEVEAAAYFLLSEAVTNSLKHSGASAMAISLRVDDGWLTVSATDDGRGFALAEAPRGGGLLHMEDRVRSFGGTLRIGPAPGRGTAVIASFPLHGHGGRADDASGEAAPAPATGPAAAATRGG